MALDRDRCLGALLGLAVGDALGAPLENLAADEIRERHGGPVTDMVGGGWLDVAPGQVTDDTEMALCLADCLVEVGGFNPDHVLAAYSGWHESEPRDEGATVATVLDQVRAGKSPHEATAEQHEQSGGRSAGNGALMRTTPIGIAFATHRELVRDVSLAEAALTHYDPLAGKACAYHNETLATLITQGHAAAAQETIDPTGVDDRIADVLIPAASGVRTTAERIAAEQGGYVIATLAVAMTAWLTAESFEEGLVWAVNLGGDADTNGAVAGALLGARFGATTIPTRWLDPLEPRARLEALTPQLMALAG